MAQATLARFVEEFRAGRHDRERGRLRAWIFAIARARALDVQRARARRREVRGESVLGQLQEEASWSGHLDTWWRAALLRHALVELREGTKSDPRTVRVIELMAFQQKSAADIAAELGMDVNAV